MDLKSVGVAVAVALSVSGCIDREKLMIEARENGVIVYANGFLSDENRKMTSGLAKDLGMAHVSTRKDILEMMKAGENSHYGNHVAFHSAGSDSAYNFVEWCQQNGIEIRGVYSMEAFTKRRFPNNVGVVINYRAPGKWTFGEHESLGGVVNRTQDVAGAEHLNLPWKAEGHIRGEIIGYQRDVNFRKVHRRTGK